MPTRLYGNRHSTPEKGLSPLLDSLARRLKLEPRELRDALWLAAALFTITCSYTLIKTARDSLYLSQLPARQLPYVYLGVGFLTLGISAVFARATRRMSALAALVGTAGVSAAVLMAFATTFDIKRMWVPAGFYVWVNVYGLILVSQFWAFTAGIADPREAKRIFGIVGGGGIVGGLVGGLVAGQVGQHLGLAPLTVVGAALVASLVPVVLFGLRHRHAAAEEPAAENGEAETPTWRHPYVRWLALMVLCSVVVTGLLDYQLKLQVQLRHPSAERLAAFFGAFYTVINIAALALQLIGTRLMLQRLGAGYSALVLPAGVMIGAIATLASPAFYVVLATRLWEQVGRFSVHKSALELFYFPIEPGLRRRAKAIIEAGIERFGDGLAGILILALGIGLRENITVLASLAVALVLVWLVAWFQVRRRYVQELGKSLRDSSLDREQRALSLRELSALKEMVRLLDSPYERVVLHGIEMLEDNAPRLLDKRIGKLLEHPSPRVRTRAVKLAAQGAPAETRQQIAAMVEDDDPVVRIEALRALLALGKDEPTRALDEFIASDDPRVRATALRLYVEYAPPSDDEVARDLLRRLLSRDDVADRVAAAEAIGFRPAPSRVHELLAPLFEDADLEVRRAAMRTAGLVGRRDDVPVLLRALAEHDVTEAARAGLVGYGERVIGTLGDYLIDPSIPLEVRREIPRVLADLPHQSAADALFRGEEEDGVIGYRALKAANRLRLHDPGLRFPVERVEVGIDRDLAALAGSRLRVRALEQGGGDRDEEKFLVTAVRERGDQALNRVFRRLALLYPPAVVLAAYRGIISEDARARGNALEYLENELEPRQRDLLLPVVENRDDGEWERLAEERFGLRPASYADTLAHLVGEDDPWLRAVALHVAGVRRERSLLGAIESALESADARVRESAVWARRALGGGEVAWQTP